MPQGRNEEIRKDGIGIGKKKKKKKAIEKGEKGRERRTTEESVYVDIRCRIQERGELKERKGGKGSS